MRLELNTENRLLERQEPLKGAAGSADELVQGVRLAQADRAPWLLPVHTSRKIKRERASAAATSQRTRTRVAAVFETGRRAPFTASANLVEGPTAGSADACDVRKRAGRAATGAVGRSDGR